VELYWDRARDEWPVRPDGGIDMYTRPLDVRDLLATAAGYAADPDVDIGHAHLKVTDIDRAIAFWRDEVGMDLKVTYGREAAFLAAGDYHHHIGANTWYSGGGAAKPEDALGLERVTLAVPGGDGSGAGLLSDPDGILVELRADPA
jgi:catechol 2,3-dioxygenase